MIRHVVLWELHDAALAGAFTAAMAECEALVPGMRSFELGRKQADLPATADVCLIATFDDADALRRYQQHPRHVAVSQRIAPWRKHRHVLDFAVDDGGLPGGTA